MADLQDAHGWMDELNLSWGVDWSDSGCLQWVKGRPVDKLGYTPNDTLILMDYTCINIMAFVCPSLNTGHVIVLYIYRFIFHFLFSSILTINFYLWQKYPFPKSINSSLTTYYSTHCWCFESLCGQPVRQWVCRDQVAPLRSPPSVSDSHAIMDYSFVEASLCGDHQACQWRHVC